MSEVQLRQFVACPDCRGELTRQKNAVSCHKGHRFALTEHGVPQLLPHRATRSPLWVEWEAKQTEGLEDYTNPDEHYHEISGGVAKLFGSFAEFHGTILDIGCGIHPQLPYVPNGIYDKTTYIGLDPMPPERATPFLFVQGLAEQLPFQNKIFDQIILATSLDHMIDLKPVFAELRRVLKPDGEVVIWSTVIEYIPAQDIRLGTWLKETLYLLSRFQWRRAARRFLLPYPVAGLDYRPTDRYHFHRFTRQSIEELFTRERWAVKQAYYLEDPINLGSKHLFTRITPK